MAQDTRLDDIDRTILMLLQEDGRMTNTTLAEAVGLTPTPMLQRIKKLEQAGVIRRYMAVVDPVKVGRPIQAFVHVTLKNHTLPNHQRFLRSPRAWPRCWSAITSPERRTSSSRSPCATSPSSRR